MYETLNDIQSDLPGKKMTDDEDIGEMWRDHKKIRQEKRADNRKSSAEILAEHGIEYKSFNDGAHLVVGEFDFWPGTGLFIRRKTRERGRGVLRLIKMVTKC